MKVAEFVAEVVLKGGKESTATMKGLMSSTIAAKAAFLAATAAFYKFSDIARQSALYMDMYQLNTGLSTIQLQKLSFQASQAGVSMTELGGAIQKLQQANAKARLGYGWDPILTRFGLQPGQDPVSQLNKISSALRRLGATNPAEAHALAMKAGLSDNIYYALMRGTTEQMERQFILTNKEQQSLVKLNQQWNKFWFYLKQIGIKLQALSSTFQERVVVVLTRAIKGFYELFSRIYKVFEASESLKTALIALGLVLTAYFAPWLLVLGAIVLVLEDIYTYFEGGDSITGDIINWVKNSKELKDIWEGICTIFKLLKQGLTPIGEEFKFIYDQVKKLLQLIDEHPVLKSILEYVLKSAKQAAATTLSPALAGVGALGDIAGNAEEYIKAFAPLGNVSYNTHIVAHIASTGDVAQDTRNVMTFEKEARQAQGQQANLANGSNGGGNRYNKREK